MPRPLAQASRIAPVETSVYSVTGTLIDFRREDDGDDYLVLADEAGRTIIAEIPAVDCVDPRSVFRNSIGAARQAFENRFNISSMFQHPAVPIEVQGVGFFDYLQDQRGAAPNGIELHPVLAVNFAPLITPAAPFAGRRHAVRPIGGSPCSKPALALKASSAGSCPGSTVTLTWQASDPSASVSIDDVGLALPASGSRVLTVTSSTAYSGRATNACGVSAEAVAVVNVDASATASVSASPNIIPFGGTSAITVSISNTTGWTLASALGNPLNPSRGTSNVNATYTGSRSGTDTITLTAKSACGDLQRSTTITVAIAPPPPPPPPPPPSGLLCCDGTRSPTCFSCANKSGCCSSHKGVCGCP